VPFVCQARSLVFVGVLHQQICTLGWAVYSPKSYVPLLSKQKRPTSTI
jgi:hypothetical protein